MVFNLSSVNFGFDNLEPKHTANSSNTNNHRTKSIKFTTACHIIAVTSQLAVVVCENIAISFNKPIHIATEANFVNYTYILCVNINDQLY